MKIEEQKVYTFHLPFQTGMVSINVVAETREHAAQIVKDWLEQGQKELALLFPRVSVPVNAIEEAPVTLNALQIGLISDMVNQIPGYDGTLDMPTLTKAVKKLTKLELTLENFKEIIPLLEKQKNV